MRSHDGDEPHLTVIKVGGSLLAWPELPGRLASLLSVEADRGSRVVLIVGGGPAADFVRTLDAMHEFGDQAAHRLALHALDFTAELLARLLPGSRVVHRLLELPSAWHAGWRPILAPRVYLEEVDERRPDRLAFSWDVTSDTIAARVALDLKADRLLLLKSVSASEAMTRAEAAEAGLVDPSFPGAAQALERVEVVGFRDASIKPRALMR